MIEYIGTVGVYVDDQERAVRFWTEQVGFEERRRVPMGNGMFWLEVAPRGAQSGLVLYPKKLMTNWSELKPSVVFQCSDIDAVYAALKDNGVFFAKELAQMPWGKFASFLDLDGNEFGIRGAWEK
jgi:predicted enzyme related to lactoylglutathione lyase